MLSFFSFSGYQLSNTALSSIILRYHNKKGTIPFDIFIQILVRVIVMFGKSDTEFLIFFSVVSLSGWKQFSNKVLFYYRYQYFKFKHIDLFLVIPFVKTKSRNIFQEIIQNQVIVEQNPALSCDRNLRVGTISWVFISKSAREWTSENEKFLFARPVQGGVATQSCARTYTKTAFSKATVTAAKKQPDIYLNSRLFVQI